MPCRTLITNSNQESINHNLYKLNESDIIKSEIILGFGKQKDMKANGVNKYQYLKRYLKS